jgi:hypothetical protein
MKFVLNLNEALSFSAEIPAKPRGHHLLGSLVKADSNGYGKLLLQELPSEAGTVYYHAYQINRKTEFWMQDQRPFLCACIALQDLSQFLKMKTFIEGNLNFHSAN